MSSYKFHKHSPKVNMFLKINGESGAQHSIQRVCTQL